MNSVSEAGLLTFDETSPLFIKKKTIGKRKPRKAKPKVTDIVDIEELKPAKRTRGKAKKKSINKDAPKHSIVHPSDCKHVLPAFKKQLAKIWIDLEDGNDMDATDIASYLRGVAFVAKKKRPKEYEEFKVLIMLARQMAEQKKRDD